LQFQGEGYPILAIKVCFSDETNSKRFH